MEFGSSFILCQDSTEEETISEEEFQRPLRLHNILDEISGELDEPSPKRPGVRASCGLQAAVSRGQTSKGLISGLGIQHVDGPSDGSLGFSVKNMVNVLSDTEVGFAAADWDSLGLQLVEVHEKDNIRASSSDPHTQLSGLLTLWVRSNPGASWEKLATAVSKIPKYGRGTARRIRIKAGIKTEGPLPCEKVIIHKYPDICRCLSLDIAFPYMVKSRVISSDQRKELLELSPTDRVEKFLLWLQDGDDRLLQKFIACLKSSAHDTNKHEHLATTLQQELNELDPNEVDGMSVRAPDTNVVTLQLNQLTEPAKVHAGDPVICSSTQCTAVMSHLSQVNTIEDRQSWVCEFCGTVNKVDITPEEIPADQDTSFVMSPPSHVEEDITGCKLARDAILVFCVDVFGSMCTTTEVAGSFKLKSHADLEDLSQSLKIDLKSQVLPKQKSNRTYISRLESVQEAVNKQLMNAANSAPSLRVAIVTFANDVTVYTGDQREEIVLAGDRLSDAQEIMTKADTLPMPRILRQAKNFLLKKVMGLKEEGQTALGPALLVSIMLAGKLPGSKVIICTDGLANVGVGSLDDDSDLESAQEYYKMLGDIAMTKGVTVSAISFEGTECRLIEISRVVQATGGELTRVDPTGISREFSSILANPAIAINVTCHLVAHKDLYFQSNDSQESLLTVLVGNVKADTELSYGFGVRNESTLRACPNNEDLKIPFQLQVDHILPDGSHMMRVFTNTLPVTHDKKSAEKSINMAVVGYHAVRSAASLAAGGRFKEARITALMAERVMKRASGNDMERRMTYMTVMGELVPLDNRLQMRLPRSTESKHHQLLGQMVGHSPVQYSESRWMVGQQQSQSSFVHDEPTLGFSEAGIHEATSSSSGSTIPVLRERTSSLDFQKGLCLARKLRTSKRSSRSVSQPPEPSHAPLPAKKSRSSSQPPTVPHSSAANKGSDVNVRPHGSRQRDRMPPSPAAGLGSDMSPPPAADIGWDVKAQLHASRQRDRACATSRLSPMRHYAPPRSFEIDDEMAVRISAGRQATSCGRAISRAKPKLDQLIQLKGTGKTIHVISHISGHLDDIARALQLRYYLISTIKEQSNTPFDATLNVMVQWMGGEGRKPVTWRTLLEALKEAHLHSLASDLEEVLGEEEDA